MRLRTDRPAAVREAIDACRKGRTVFTLGVFAGLVDKFPLGAVMLGAGVRVQGLRTTFSQLSCLFLKIS